MIYNINMKRKRLILLLGIILLLLLGALIYLYIEKNSGIIITQYSDDSGVQAMFYTIESKGELYIIDGGNPPNAEQVKKVINEKGGEVRAWILTHPHPDHIGAFNQIYPALGNINIDKIYTIDMDYALYQEYAREWDDFPTFDTFCNITAGAKNISYLHTGDVLDFPGIKMEVYNAYDDTIINYSDDLPNQGSLVFKIYGESESMLFCSDIHGEAICDKVADEYEDKLESTYLQMGHHGNNSVTKEFISLVNPKAAFFDAPQWLVEGEDYDTQENIDYVLSTGAEVYTYATAPNCIKLH